MQKNSSISSMTAYGSGEAVSKEGRFFAEIQSVNRRFLEINVNLPEPSAALEMQLKNHLSEKLARGQISLSLSWQREGTLGIKPNLQLAQELKEGWEAIATKLEIDVPFDLNLLSHQEELFFVERTRMPEKQIIEAVETALENLLDMRRFEGAKLEKDLRSRLAFLKTAVAAVENGSKGGVEHYKEKLVKRLAELAEEEDERLLREVAIFAEKVDVTEEIVRFRIHLENFEMTLNEGGPCGKKLDFLIQELLREANTMGSKGQMTIEIKSELEKLREQVQNIE